MPTVTVTAAGEQANVSWTEGGWNLGGRNVYAIQQLYSPSVSGLATQVAQAKANGATGFGIRVPWNYLTSSLTLLDQARQIADNNDMVFAPRFMAGAYTPDSVKTAMGAGFRYTSSTAPVSGLTVPMPVNSAGQFNTVYEDAYGDFVGTLGQWCASNDVPLLHLSWYGMAYSELYYGPEVQFNKTGFINGHKRLVEIAAAVQPAGVTFEFAMSGHGPIVDVGESIAAHMRLKMPEADRAAIQANGWSNTGQWGQSQQSIDTQMDARFGDGNVVGVQAIQPWGQASYAQYTAAQATAAFQQATTAGARYAEIYLPSLTNAAGGSVWSAPIAAWINADS